MERQSGSTLFELVTVLAVAAVFASIAVPSAARMGAAVSSAEGARRLALVLRAAQAEAQSRSTSVRVEVDGEGAYVVTAGAESLMSGSLGTRVTSTYPGGVLEYTRRGWAGLPGSSSPRAGHFSVDGVAASRTVVVQLSGCVRCT
jgi:Tfp pilus assembly protein FimT